MAGFLLAHPIEDLGGCGEVLPQSFRVLGVDTLVFLFERNGKGQDLTFGQAVEAAHVFIMSGSQPKKKPRYADGEQQ